MVLHEKIEGKFIGKLHSMTRSMLGLKNFSNQQKGKMLKISEGNRNVKREILVKTESDCRMNNCIKKEKK